MSPLDVAVVGGGIVGLATAYRIRQQRPAAGVVVFEREPAVGRHQSSHNSGVLHSGIYYPPGSRKAVLCRQGKAAMEAFAAEHGIPVERNGKLVVAVDERELPGLDVLAARAEANGVAGARVVGPAELREIEPHVRGLRGLHVPSTAVIDFGAVCHALAAGQDVRTGTEVTELAGGPRSVRVVTNAGELDARVAVVCAGLWSSQLARRAGESPSVRIVPFRGSWVALRPSGAALVRGNVYPVPDPELPFLGVHFTKRIDGTVWAGPNATLSFAPASVLRDALGFPGSWRLARRAARTGMRELWLARRRVALRAFRRYLPELVDADVDWSNRPFGVRAQAVARDGSLVDDFVIEGSGRVVSVLNAPSPAATAALAIGEVVAGEVLARLDVSSSG